jgi:cytochrome c-type protein NapC
MMPGPLAILFVLLGTTIVLLIVLLTRASLTATPAGKILVFLAFCALPILCGFWGLNEHLERSKQTAFCLSCHIMEPYGRSLYAADPMYIPAAHFENHRIPAEEACYTCHTDYAMYGTIRVKLHGLRHIYVQYFGTPMNPIHLYDPYNNRECLHCHAGARSFENDTHMALLDQIKANQLSCVSSGCHDTIHNAASIDKVKMWKSQE